MTSFVAIKTSRLVLVACSSILIVLVATRPTLALPDIPRPVADHVLVLNDGEPWVDPPRTFRHGRQILSGSSFVYAWFAEIAQPIDEESNVAIYTVRLNKGQAAGDESE